jgi:hypothetical protein
MINFIFETLLVLSSYVHVWEHGVRQAPYFLLNRPDILTAISTPLRNVKHSPEDAARHL